MEHQIRVDMTTKYKMLPMVQECFQNLQAKTFNNRAHVVHFLLCRPVAKEISLLIFTKRALCLDSSEVRLSFQIKMGVFIPG